MYQITPRFADAFTEQTQYYLGVAEAALSQPENQREQTNVCALHHVVIGTIYLTGKFEAGFELLRSLSRRYRAEPEIPNLEEEITETINSSSHFVSR